MYFLLIVRTLFYRLVVVIFGVGWAVLVAYVAYVAFVLALFVRLRHFDDEGGIEIVVVARSCGPVRGQNAPEIHLHLTALDLTVGLDFLVSGTVGRQEAARAKESSVEERTRFGGDRLASGLQSCASSLSILYMHESLTIIIICMYCIIDVLYAYHNYVSLIVLYIIISYV